MDEVTNTLNRAVELLDGMLLDIAKRGDFGKVGIISAYRDMVTSNYLMAIQLKDLLDTRVFEITEGTNITWTK